MIAPSRKEGRSDAIAEAVGQQEGTVRPDSAPDGGDMRTVRFEIAPRSIVSVLAVAAGLWLLVRVWQTILLLVIALILAGTVGPVVRWLERRGVGRAPALGLVLLGLLGAVAGLGTLIIPVLVAQVGELAARAPRLQAQLADTLAGVPMLAGGADVVRRTEPARLAEPLGAYALSLAGALAQVVALGVTTVILAFYLLADHERVRGFIFALLPRRFHLRAARIILDMQTVVGGYVRGQVVTSVLIGIVVFAVLWAVGTPNALALAVFAAFADLIPFVGGILALAPAVLATLPQGLAATAVVFVVTVGYHQLESHVLIPRIYGQTLRLSPLAVLVALLIGGQLLGIVGALLALPLAAGLRVLVEQLRIDLPGEQPGEPSQRAEDAQAEAEYTARTRGASGREAAAVATAIAEHEQEDEHRPESRSDTPVEERGDPPPQPRAVG